MSAVRGGTGSNARLRQGRAGPPVNPFLVFLAGIAAVFFVLPIAALLVRAPWTTALAQLTSEVTLQALKLSLVCSVGATLVSIALGVPLAWVQARLEFPGKTLLRGITTLPVVLPPVVGGAALLLAFGRRGLVGQPMAGALGVSLPFTTAGVIVAEAFVSMPFLIISVEAGLRSMNARLEDAARTLGAGRWLVFRTITLPLIAPSLVAGAVLSWSRALGEFGATITFAGNFPGTTQTLPLAVYVNLEGQSLDAGIMMSLVLVAISLAVLVALRERFLGGG